MKASEVLRKSGDVLRERGWCQGEFDNLSGQRCALGAIRDFVGNEWVQVAIPLEVVVGVYPRSVAPWNDVPGRTVDEVLAAMDAAYVLALQEEGTEPEDVL